MGGILIDLPKVAWAECEAFVRARVGISQTPHHTNSSQIQKREIRNGIKRPVREN